MTTIRSAGYGETETALSRHPLTTAMAYRRPIVAGKVLADLTRAELIDHKIAHADASGLFIRPTFEFTQACNASFRRLEEANPSHKWTGPLHIGAVAAAMLIIWRESREAAMAFSGLSEAELDSRLAAGETSRDIILEVAKRANQEKSKDADR